MIPRYLVLYGRYSVCPCENLTHALEAADANHGRVYEPLAMTAAERIHAEPMDVTSLSLEVARLEEEKAALLAACETALHTLEEIEALDSDDDGKPVGYHAADIKVLRAAIQKCSA